MVPERCVHAALEHRAGSRTRLGRSGGASDEGFPRPTKSAIRAFHDRWEETVSGTIDENVALLGRLRDADVPNYCITNFSAPKFALSQTRYPFLAGFDGIIVSGDERMLKPEPEIYNLLLARYGLSAGDCIFIDDFEGEC